MPARCAAYSPSSPDALSTESARRLALAWIALACASGGAVRLWLLPYALMYVTVRLPGPIDSDSGAGV